MWYKSPEEFGSTQATAATHNQTVNTWPEYDIHYSGQNCPLVTSISRMLTEDYLYEQRGVGWQATVIGIHIFSRYYIYVEENIMVYFKKICYYDCMTFHAKTGFDKVLYKSAAQWLQFQKSVFFSKQSFWLMISPIFYNELPSRECHKTLLMTMNSGLRRWNSALVKSPLILGVDRAR